MSTRNSSNVKYGHHILKFSVRSRAVQMCSVCTHQDIFHNEYWFFLNNFCSLEMIQIRKVVPCVRSLHSAASQSVDLPKSTV